MHTQADIHAHTSRHTCTHKKCVVAGNYCLQTFIILLSQSVRTPSLPSTNPLACPNSTSASSCLSTAFQHLWQQPSLYLLSKVNACSRRSSVQVGYRVPESRVIKHWILCKRIILQLYYTTINIQQ